MQIVIGSDHRGAVLRKAVVEFLQDNDFPINWEYGPSISGRGTPPDPGTASKDYPVIAAYVCNEIITNQADRGILICGTGLGMAIAANKFAGIRAAPVRNLTEAIMCKKHNNANIICLGESAKEPLALIAAWLATQFEDKDGLEPSRHAKRVEMLASIENKIDLCTK